MSRITDRIITALDYSEFTDVKALVERLGEYGVFYKVGLELYLSCGEQVLTYLKEQGKKIFLDLKFHDIPNTVSHAVKNVAKYNVDLTNVHALGGYEMMKQSKEMLLSEGADTKLIAVTILTSMNQKMLNGVGLEGEVADHVKNLAVLTKSAGLDGVVASPLEAEMIHATCGTDFLTVTPGIRLSSDGKDDQQRVLTPTKALTGHSSYIVMGRSITGAKDPQAVFETILSGKE